VKDFIDKMSDCSSDSFECVEVMPTTTEPETNAAWRAMGAQVLLGVVAVMCFMF